jgi:hypothetical protein
VSTVISERSILERSIYKMTSVNNVSGNGQEALGAQSTDALSELTEVGKGGLDAGFMPVEPDGSDIEIPGGINPETSPKEYVDGSADKVSGFEELSGQEAESARKEQNDNTSKVLQHMEKIYLGEETGPESLGETAGKEEGVEASKADNESS